MKRILLASFLLSSFSALATEQDITCLLRGDCFTGKDVLKHLQALQKIADENNGNRAAGSRGHEMSANYIAQRLLAVGYQVSLEPFEFMKFDKFSASFGQAAPAELSYKEGVDFNVMSYSGAGSVTAPISGVDLDLGPDNNSTSGCEMEDFTEFPKGHIALIQRGTCGFADKAINAQKAGAAGVIIFNQGNSPDREDLLNGTLSDTANMQIPVFSVPYKLAVDLLAQEGVQLRLQADTKTEKKVSYNVIAESQSGNPDNVVMVGAHLDSVAEGPGINDNGSGSAAVLEVALKLSKIQTKNKVRFAWFSAEELGLIGSTRYVEDLTQAQKDQIALYINVDMVGSPNYMISVFDGDGSRFGQKGPEGSAELEKMFHDFFALQGVQSVESELNGRSDYAAFSAAGIAVAGIFTGAEGAKSEEEAALFGGVAGEAYDSCYHQKCDSIENISVEALNLNTNALAYMTLSLGHSTAAIRSENKLMSPLKKRNKVVFPKHLHCHEDVYDM